VGGALNHLGVEVESTADVHSATSRLSSEGLETQIEDETTCCYAQSEKSWIDDPAGIAWETFFTTGESTHYGTSREEGARIAHAKACCGSAEADKPAAETSCCSAAAEASCCPG